MDVSSTREELRDLALHTEPSKGVVVPNALLLELLDAEEALKGAAVATDQDLIDEVEAESEVASEDATSPGPGELPGSLSAAELEVEGVEGSEGLGLG